MMTRRQAIAAGLALTAGAALPVRAARASAPDPADAEFFPWTALGEGVHAIIDPATGGNCLLAVDAGQAVLVDTKFPAIAPALLREATARAGRLAHVVNTHHHLDHTGGNHAFRAAGVPVVAHHRAGPRIAGNFEQAVRHARGGPGFVANLDRAGQSRTLKDAGTLIEALPGMDAGDWAPTALLDEAVQRSWGFMDGLEGEQVRARAISAVYRELAGRD